MSNEVNITAPCVGVTRKGVEVLLLPNDRDNRDVYPWVYYCDNELVAVTSRGRLYIFDTNYEKWPDDKELDIVHTRPANATDFREHCKYIIEEYGYTSR